MVLSVIVTLFMESISGVWSFVIECGAGLGLVLILRWFWWRINAVSEITATVTPFFVYAILYFAKIDIAFPDTLFIIVPFTTIAWIIATFLTKPSEESKLSNFYKTIRPGGPGWKQMRLNHPDVKNDKGYGYLFLNWILGIVLVYMFLFGIGKIIFAEYFTGLMFIATGVLSAVFIAVNLKKHDSLFE
jgi:hypothetical protein